MSGEKTEKATPKRRRDERRKGNVFVSKDVVTVVTLIGGLCMLKITLLSSYMTLKQFLLKYFGYMETMADLQAERVIEMVLDAVQVAIDIVLPLMAFVMLLSIAATVYQTKPLFVTEPLKPKFSKLNPIKGLKNLFSLKKVFDVIKGIIKILILLYILFDFIRDEFMQLPRLLSMNLLAAGSYMFQSAFIMAMKICAAFVAVSVLDYYYQRWDHERQMKMSKQEIKEEYKQMEGDPKIKGKIKQMQRQRAMARMMQQVPDADVVIKNPTHFAVALRYDPEKDEAPVLLAKGQDYVALRIIKVAEENNVTVIENRPLARGIFAATELNQQLPPEFYGAVAEILVHIYKLNHKI